MRRRLLWGLATGLSVLTCLAYVRYAIREVFLYEAKRTPSPYAPLPDTELAEWYKADHDVAREMRWRQESMKEACPEIGWEVEGGPSDYKGIDKIMSRNTSLLRNFIVDDEHKVLYCYVPKVACTNWKRIMMILTGGTNETDPLNINSTSVHEENVFVGLHDLEPDAIRHRLRTYTKFLFVRHPIERLVSAFRNKFENNLTNSDFFKTHYGVDIMKRYRKGVDSESIPKTGHGVRFPEFVSYLIDTKHEEYNEHWALFSSLCFPCDVRYDFIGKYETLLEDAKFILQQIGAPPSLHFPYQEPTKTTAFVPSYFASLTSEQQRNLVQIYAEDFRIFGYHFKDFI